MEIITKVESIRSFYFKESYLFVNYILNFVRFLY